MPGSRRLLLVLPLALLASAAHAADPALAGHLQDLLGAYEEPPTSEDLKAAGPEAVGILRAFATDPSRPLAFRARAVHALGNFPDEANRALLLGWAHDAALPGIIRRRAIHALANGWGDAEAAHIGAFLADPDIDTRMTAAQALGRLSDAARRPRLEQRLAVESNAAVKAVIVRALASEPE
ncbi:MAG: HEAT repeat domain-containing protein [Deltaproteobacteria bacterium]|nr:HEAT repeat domain-containing protein [Deltaproteobacteria bacterium]